MTAPADAPVQPSLRRMRAFGVRPDRDLGQNFLIDSNILGVIGRAAVELLREAFPDLKMRFVNVVDLFALQPESEHPHGLPDRDFDSLFTLDKPVIFNFHGYPWLIHRLAYRRTNHHNIHVRGYKEKGNINTPLELAIKNQIDRFSIAIDVIDRVPRLKVAGAHVKEMLRNRQISCMLYAHEHGIDPVDLTNWTWKR